MSDRCTYVSGMTTGPSLRQSCALPGVDERGGRCAFHSLNSEVRNAVNWSREPHRIPVFFTALARDCRGEVSGEVRFRDCASKHVDSWPAGVEDRGDCHRVSSELDSSAPMVTPIYAAGSASGDGLLGRPLFAAKLMTLPFRLAQLLAQPFHHGLFSLGRRPPSDRLKPKSLPELLDKQIPDYHSSQA